MFLKKFIKLLPIGLVVLFAIPVFAKDAQATDYFTQKNIVSIQWDTNSSVSQIIHLNHFNRYWQSNDFTDRTYEFLDAYSAKTIDRMG